MDRTRTFRRFRKVDLPRWGACLAMVSGAIVAASTEMGAKAQLLYTEDFNTDGVGTRYTTSGRGLVLLTVEGNQEAAYWTLSSDVVAAGEIVGVVVPAAGRRAALVFQSAVPDGVVTPEGQKLIDNTVKWLTGDTKGNVLFSPAVVGDGDLYLQQRLTDSGYTVSDDDTAAAPPAPNTVALAITTSGGVAPTRFTRYGAPVLTYNGPNHDDMLVSSIGTGNAFLDLGEVTITDPAHPIAAGLPPTFQMFTGEVGVDTVGTTIPDSAKVIATYKFTDPDTGEESNRPLLIVIEKGDGLLGGPFNGFEGTGFWAGADMNEPTITPDCCASNDDPRRITLNPVNVAGKTDVRITAALAATDIDFENSDFLRIMIDPDGDGPEDFVLLANFTPPTGNDKYFADEAGENRLSAKFRDVTFKVPAGATSLVVRFESMSTFFNEIVAIDNVRIHAGDLPPAATDLVSASTSVGAPPAAPGTGLQGRYWQRAPKELTTLLGTTGAVERIVAKLPQTASFTSKSLNYTGNDLTPVENWLGADAASLNISSPGNLDDGLFVFNGWLAVRQPGQIRFSTPSDDGSVVVIGDRTVINNDGSHGAPGPSPDGTATFTAAGLYPITVSFFNGDWVNDAGTEHGGASIQFTSDGAGGIGAANGVVPTAALYNGTDLKRVSASVSIGPVPAAAGTGLDGRYWQRAPKEIAALFGTNGVVDSVVKKVAPTALFTASTINYTGNDLTPLPDWLGKDGASLNVSAPGNLDDGLLSMEGWIAIKSPGAVQFSTPSDDGSVVTIGGTRVVDNDGSHGAPGPSPTGTVTFEAAGLYPISIHYFNGDWLNDAGTEHGGASLQFTSNGAGGIGAANAVVPTAVLYGGTDLRYVPSYSVSGPSPAAAGTGLDGQYWQREPKSIAALFGTNGVVGPVTRAVPPTATFHSTTVNYTGNDLTPVQDWLAADGASLSSPAPGNLDDGLFRFSGFLNITSVGPVRFSTPSDDGSVVMIGGIRAVNNDGSHGAPGPAPDGTVTFLARGLYPIEIHYFNGDWVNDAGTEHGGANIQFTSNGAGGIGSANAVVPANVLYPAPKTAAPSINSITLAGGSVTITWSGSARLQSADAVVGPYGDVIGAKSPYSAPVAGVVQRYYRLAE